MNRYTKKDINKLQGTLLVVAGMSRGGTTYLYNQLSRHPSIFTTVEKELCYFGFNYDKGIDWWVSRCPTVGVDQVALDVCGIYFAEFEKSIPRIDEFDSAAKVVLVLREPVEWVFSLYEHYSTMWNTPSFPEFVDGCTWHRDGQAVSLKFGDSRIQRGVTQFAKTFGDRLLILDFKLLSQDPVRMLNAIENHCGTERFFDEQTVERRKYNERMSSGAQVVLWLSKFPGMRYFARLLPSEIVSYVRRKLDRGGSSDKPVKKKLDYSKQEAGLATTKLQPDSDFYTQLFTESQILTGDQVMTRIPESQ